MKTEFLHLYRKFALIVLIANIKIWSFQWFSFKNFFSILINDEGVRPVHIVHVNDALFLERIELPCESFQCVRILVNSVGKDQKFKRWFISYFVPFHERQNDFILQYMKTNVVCYVNILTTYAEIKGITCNVSENLSIKTWIFVFLSCNFSNREEKTVCYRPTYNITFVSDGSARALYNICLKWELQSRIRWEVIYNCIFFYIFRQEMLKVIEISIFEKKLIVTVISTLTPTYQLPSIYYLWY